MKIEVPLEKLILKPSATIVAMTQFSNPALQEWAGENGYLPLLHGDDNPLARISDTSENFRANGLHDPAVIAEFGGRFCYRAFAKGRDTEDYIMNILEMAHGSVLEHVNFSFAISGVSRSLSHELVRHRAGVAISQESQRYVDAKDIQFVVPPLIRDSTQTVLQGFADDCFAALMNYVKWQEFFEYKVAGKFGVEVKDADVKLKTIIKKRANEAARAFLPNAAETRIFWTANIRSLRHVLEMRGGEPADLEVRALAFLMLEKILESAPTGFLDFAVGSDEFGPTISPAYSKV